MKASRSSGVASPADKHWPERLEVIPELPRTQTGKVQKFVLGSGSGT
jgi:acyl-coenzyme A synthetase/AMP-(fatty) acid ligase